MATLTEMLRDTLENVPDDEASIEQDLYLVKETFKEWLKEVGLPTILNTNRDGISFDATKSLRKLLITLVDEP